MSIASLFGSAGRLGVERAIAEFRSGRPVILRHGSAILLVQPVEGLDDAALATLRALAAPACPQLVVSGTRAAWAGLVQTGNTATVRIDIAATVDVREIADIAIGAARPDVPPVQEGTEVHTAAVALARLALLSPSVLTIAPLPTAIAELARVAATVSASDIFAHEVEAAHDLHIVADAPVPLRPEIASRFVVFRGGHAAHDQVAIVVGNPDFAGTVPVRLHSACLTGDLFGSLKCDCGDQLRHSIRRFAQGQGGVLLYLDQEGRGTGIANKMRAYGFQAAGADTIDADARLGFADDERRWDEAGQMLKLLGISSVALHSNNPRKAAALQAQGIEVTSREPVLTRVTRQNEHYLRTKARRSGHVIDEAWIDEAARALAPAAE